MHSTFLLISACLGLVSLSGLKAQFPSSASSAKAEHYEIFLLAGQSNMDGRASVKDLKGDMERWAIPQSDVLITFHGGGLHRPLTLSDGLRPLAPGYSGTLNPKASPGSKFLPSSTFGPEVSFGAMMAEAMPGKKLLLIKCSEGGTSLLHDWSPEEKGKLYDQFIAYVGQTLKELQAEGDTYTLRGMIWHQGESDSGLPSGKYQELLTDFIAHVRSDLQVKDLPFVIGEVFDNGKRDVVREGQRATAAAIPNAAFASSQGLKTAEGTHFIAESQIELGKRFAQATISLCKVTGD